MEQIKSVSLKNQNKGGPKMKNVTVIEKGIDVCPGIETLNGKILPQIVIVGFKGRNRDTRRLMKTKDLLNAMDDKGKLVLKGLARNRFLRALWRYDMTEVRHEHFKELLEKSIVVVIMPSEWKGSLSGFTEDDIKWLSERTKHLGNILALYPKLAHGGVQGVGIGHGGRIFICKENLPEKWYEDLDVDISEMTPVKLVERTSRLLGEKGATLENLKVAFIDEEMHGIILVDKVWGLTKGLNNGDKISGFKVKGSVMLVKGLFIKKGVYMVLPSDTVKLDGLITEDDIRVIESRRAKGNASWNVGRNPHISFEMLSLMDQTKINPDRLSWLKKMCEGDADPTDYINLIGWKDPGNGRGFPSKLVPGIMLDTRAGATLERLINKGLSMRYILKESMWIHDMVMKCLSTAIREMANPRVPGFYGVIMPWEKDAVGIPLKAIRSDHAYIVIPPIVYPVRMPVVPTRDNCVWLPREWVLAVGKDFDGDIAMGYYLKEIPALPDWGKNKKEILEFIKGIVPAKEEDAEDPRAPLEVMSDGIAHYLDIGVMTNRINIIEDIARLNGMSKGKLLKLRMEMFFGDVQPHVDALKYMAKGDVPKALDIAIKHGIKTTQDQIDTISSWFSIRRPNIEAICMMANMDTSLNPDSKSFYERMILNFKEIHPIACEFKERLLAKKQNSRGR